MARFAILTTLWWKFWCSKIVILKFSHLKMAIFRLFLVKIRKNLTKYDQTYAKTYIILVEEHLRHLYISSSRCYLYKFSCLIWRLHLIKLCTWRLEYCHIYIYIYIYIVCLIDINSLYLMLRWLEYLALLVTWETCIEPRQF